MTEQAWYKNWFNSTFYHKLYFKRDEKEAEAFINQLIHRLQPPPTAKMLDVACGKGRHSKILAAKGYQVTGIDISPDSIRHAKKAEKENLEFFVHDMRLLFRSNYFNYVFNFFTSFGYFRTRREHDAAFRTIATSLISGGLFVIDYLNVHYAEAHLVASEVRQIGDTQYDIQRWDDETHFYKKITVSDPSLKQPMAYTERVAKFSLGDFTDMLSYQGLQVQEVFGDYSFNHYDVKQSQRLIILASK